MMQVARARFNHACFLPSRYKVGSTCKFTGATAWPIDDRTPEHEAIMVPRNTGQRIESCAHPAAFRPDERQTAVRGPR